MSTTSIANENSLYSILDLSTRETREVDIDEARRVFDATGVLVLPGFFSNEEMDPARREMARYFAPLAKDAFEIGTGFSERQKHDTGCDIISWDPVEERNAIMTGLNQDPRLAALTEVVLGPGYTGAYSLVMYSVGGGRGQAWHQDCPSEPADAFNLNRLIYAEDIHLDDGAIVVVPGSHRFGRIPAGGHQDPIEGEVTLTPTAGTLVLLHGHVYHRVTPNLNSKPRTSINFRAFPAGIAPEVTCIGIYRNGSVNFCDKNKQHDGTPV